MGRKTRLGIVCTATAAVVGSYAVGLTQRSAEVEDGPAATRAPTSPANPTFGGFSPSVRSVKDLPDLLAVVMDDGGKGYVYRRELIGGEGGVATILTAYAEDGTTEIGTFTTG